MATFNKFNDYSEQLCRGTHQWHAAGHTFKVYLSNATPDAAADTVKADLAEITPGNGYTSAGHDIQNDLSETGGTTSITAVDVTITATGGSVGPFQYAVIYNDTAASDNLVGWIAYPSAITLADGESFTVDFGATLMTVA